MSDTSAACEVLDRVIDDAERWDAQHGWTGNYAGTDRISRARQIRDVVFCFSRADVKHLLTVADREEETHAIMGSNTYRSPLRGLAERIATLMPPE